MIVKHPTALVFNLELFGEKLKAARKYEGFCSVDDLSDHLATKGVYISPRSLYRYEKGTHTPSCERLAALIKELPSDCASFYLDSIVIEETRYDTCVICETQCGRFSRSSPRRR